MTINKIAHAVFDSFDNTNVVIAILNKNGSYVANKLDVFEEVFAEPAILDELCRKIDDGQEPLISQIDGFVIAASSLFSGFEQIGYSIMLIPIETFKSFDFIEVILQQFSQIAGLIEQNQQLRESSQVEQSVFEMPVLTNVN